MIALTDEQQMLRDAVSGLLRDHPPEARDGLWRALIVDMGLGGAFLPERLGGMASGAVEIAVLMREAAAALFVGPLFETLVLPGVIARHCPSSPALADCIARVMAGEARLAFALGERESRFDPLAVRTIARREGAGYRIDGGKIMVRGAAGATDLLIVARGGEAGDLSLFLAPAGSAGIERRDYRCIDGMSASDLRFDDLRLPAAALLGEEGQAAPLVAEMVAYGLLATCAEMVGNLRAMLDLTVRHVKDRHQFGHALAHFQALRHHLVDSWSAMEQAESMLAFAAAACDGPTEARDAALSAAKAHMGMARQMIGKYALQFHGAMGITAEAKVSRHFRHATALESRFGDTDHHLGRVIAAGGFIRPDALLSAQDAAFRAEVRAFLAEALTPDIRARVDGQAGFICEPDLHRDWQAILMAKGWDVPLWPVEHGGTGWTATQRYIFQSELAAAGAPFGAGMGINLCAPVLIAFGTDAQKSHFLPRIRSGADYWAQGFSEPGSGSDLASLSMRAVRDGADYVVNGSKIWTTHAHHANWIFLLLRTSIEERKQDGLSFLLCPLDLPGISIRPIPSMSGEHEVNQVFFDDVRVPAGNLVGDEGGGWAMARYLLGFERGGRPFAAGLWRRMAEARAIAAAEPDGRGGRLIDDPVFRHRLALVEIALTAADWTERRFRLARGASGAIGVAEASLLKLLASERTQEVQALTMECLGPYAAVDQRPALLPDVTDAVVGPDSALTPTARYLNGRAYTIFGGASEVQRDILARVALDLG
ncbi:MAG: acyl-CoA dehydrogenase [Sphingobium sp.]